MSDDQHKNVGPTENGVAASSEDAFAGRRDPWSQNETSEQGEAGGQAAVDKDMQGRDEQQLDDPEGDLLFDGPNLDVANRDELVITVTSAVIVGDTLDGSIAPEFQSHDPIEAGGPIGADEALVGQSAPLGGPEFDQETPIRRAERGRDPIETDEIAVEEASAAFDFIAPPLTEGFSLREANVDTPLVASGPSPDAGRAATQDEPAPSTEPQAQDAAAPEAEPIARSSEPVNLSPSGVAMGAAEIAENVVGGVIARVSASDDQGVSWSVNDPRFEIVGGMLRLRAGESLDFETEPTVSLTITASDPFGQSGSAIVSFDVTDQNDVGQVFTSGGAASTSEATRDDAVIYTATTTDIDTTGERITYSLTDDAGGLFEIDAVTGEVSLAPGRALDYETATSHSITIESSDGINTGSQTVTIAVTDENDVGQVFTSGGAATTSEATSETAVIYTAATTDIDTTGEAITYSLTDDAGGLFEINAVTGEVSLAPGRALDYETATSHSITIQSSDGVNTASQTVAISVTDENDVGQVFTSGGAATTSEAAADTAVLYTATTTDVDTTGETITYSLTDDAGGLFEIDAATGEVSLAAGRALDYETATSHSITIQSSDGVNTGAQTVLLTVTDHDEFDVTPVLDANGGANSVSEAAANGAMVGITARAVDADGTDSVSYSLTDDAGGRFAIDASTGVVTIADASLISFEDATSHSITVRATSTDGSTSSQSYSIAVTDVAEDLSVSGTFVDTGVAETSITGGAGDDDITAHADGGVIDGGAGDDKLRGGAGDDVLIAGGGNNDELFGGAGADRLDGSASAWTSADYRASSGGVTVDLAAGTGEGADAEGDVLIEIDGLDGSDFDDVFRGDDTRNVLQGRDGDDVLEGRGGDDQLNGGAGDDVISGDAGDDGLSGGFGDDTLTGGAGDDTLLGGHDNDTLTGGAGNDAIDGGAGADIAVFSGNWADYTITSDGAPTPTYTLTHKSAGADGQDTVTNVETFRFADGDVAVADILNDAPTDIAVASGGAVAENAANPTVVATLAATDADSGIASETASFAITNDPSGFFEISGSNIVVKSGAAINYEAATSHDVTVRVTDANGASYSETFTLSVTDQAEHHTLGDGGVTFNDNAAGSVAETSITGGAGNDDITAHDDGGVIDGGAGDDTLRGGAGIDRVVFSGALSDYAFSFDVDENLVVTDQRAGADGADTLIDIEAVTFSDGTFNLVLEPGADIGQQVDSTSARDLMVGGRDKYNMGAEGDVAVSTASGGWGRSGAGADIFVGMHHIDYRASTAGVTIDVAAGTVSGGYADGDDIGDAFAITGSDFADDLSGSRWLQGRGGDDVITGTSGNDGSAAPGGVGGLWGGAGNDTIEGGAGDDEIFGEADNDTLTGGAGNDAIDGGAGADIAVFSGNWADYTITSDGAPTPTYTLTHKSAGADGQDTVTNVETFRFADGDVAVADILNDAPTDIAVASGGAVAENAANPTVVATLAATDADSGIASETASFAITNDPSGFFEISGSNIVVKSGAAINYEAATSHDVTVRVTDANGASYSETFTLSVTDQAEHHTLGDGGVTFNDNAAGSVAETSITGGAGNDDITAHDDGGVIDGGAGDDTLRGGAGDDTLIAGGGNDTLIGGAGADRLDGSASAWSKADYRGSGAGVTVDLDAGTGVGGDAQGDTLIGVREAEGSDHNDTLSGTDQRNVLEGHDGDDSLVGRGGNDTLLGHDGADAIDGGAGNDDIRGGTGTDAAIYAGAANDYLVVDNGDGTFTVTDQNTGDGLDEGVDTLRDIEKLTFSDGTVSLAAAVDDAPTDITIASGGSVAENSANPTVVASLATTDADSGEVFTYAITNDPSGFFEISGSNIIVKAGAALDYETATSHDVTVRVTDSAGLAYTETFTINVTDENDLGQVFTSGGAATTTEAVNDSTAIYTAVATDDDTTGEQITFSLTDNAGGLFEIHATTGEVSLAAGKSLDHETATSHTITVQSSDGVNTGTQTVTINVTDVDEFDITPVSDANGGANTVNEAASNGDLVGLTARATDADGTDDVTYSLSDNAGGRFQIDATSGVVTVANASLLNFEDATSHDITVVATSDDGSSASRTYSIAVSDAAETLSVSGVFVDNGVAETRITGGTGADNITGTASADHLRGGQGDDTLTTGAGDDKLEGGAGVDTLSAGDGVDDLEGGAGNDQLLGGAGNDDLDGGDDDDTLTGGAGDDLIKGGDGADVAVFTGDMSDYDIDAGGLWFTVKDTRAGSPDGTDTIRGVETFRFADRDAAVFSDDADANSFTGGAGSDVIYGRGGNDVLAGGAGDDVLIGHNENDTLTGGAGDDIIDGGNHNDTAVFSGDLGQYSFGRDANGDLLVIDSVAGRDGTDTVRGVETLQFADLSVDMTSALVMADNPSMTAGDDVVLGTSGADAIDGGDGADRLIGGAGDDDLDGGAGNDTLDGGVGADDLDGGAGDDTLFGGAGDDTIDGGAGTGDVARFSGARSEYVITSNNDGTITVADQVAGRDGTDTISGIEVLRFTDQDVGLFVGAMNVDNTLTGAATDDIIIGLSGEDTIDGGDGSDTIYLHDSVASGQNTITDSGSSGTDRIVFDGAGATYEIQANFSAASGIEEIDGSGVAGETLRHFATSSVNWDFTNVTLTGVDKIEGTASGADQITGSAGADVIDGRGGNDVLAGGAGNDTIDGGDGADTLTGGAGNDAIDGGAGADIAVFTGNWADYTITESGGTYTLTHKSGGVDGQDTVTNVETFRFADGDVAAADILNDAPTDISIAAGGAVNENAGNPTVVATLAATDADSGIASETASFAITNDPSGFFEISGSNIIVKAGAALDFETATSHDVTVRVTDANGQTYTETLTLAVNDQAETINLGNGGVSFTDTGVAETAINGGTGDDTITIAASGGTTINAGAGADTITGGAGADTINAGDGDDVIHWTSGRGADVIDGGAGSDTLRIDGSITEFNVWHNENLYHMEDGVLIDVSNVEKVQFNDVTLTYADMIQLGEASNTHAGTSGTDFLGGNKGNDVIDGGGGDDYIFAHTDNDTVSGGGGDDYLHGGSGDDRLIGGGGDDVLEGDVDNDTAVFSGDLGQYSFGRDANGNLLVIDSVAGRDGTDTLRNIESLEFADLTIDATSALVMADSPSTTAGADTVLGTTGADTIAGGDGGDTLVGGAGNDDLDGDAGDDTLFGGAGNDALDGGAGAGDVAVFSGNWADYTITSDGAPTPTYTLTHKSGGVDGQDTVTNVETFRFADGDVAAADILNDAPTDISIAAGGAVNENAGNPTVVATLAATDADSGIASETASFAITNDPSGFFEISGSNIIVKSGAALDFETATSHDVTVRVTDANGQTYSETLTLAVNDQAETLTLGNGGVTFTDTGVSETSITGGTGNDDITAHASGGDLRGGDGADALKGAGGDDTLTGGAGDDVITGGAGVDTLSLSGNRTEYDFDLNA
ncbi:MAG: cadherin domain-containing protein, partial [Pseudomonadota bacterium]